MPSYLPTIAGIGFIVIGCLFLIIPYVGLKKPDFSKITKGYDAVQMGSCTFADRGSASYLLHHDDYVLPEMNKKKVTCQGCRQQIDAAIVHAGYDLCISCFNQRQARYIASNPDEL